ncbi:MAG TPA: dihydrolipoyl dehydrogenase [Candidatus Bathyarchaeia archaeon]|nr:dihydrolipoyl dehydrogenase [Candidatus Bathyarchaeia archaeon]
MAEGYDLTVVGGGPGGYTAAIRAAQLGLKVAIVDRDRLGGVCGNWGCIPSKALIDAAHLYDRVRQGRRQGLFTGELAADYPRIVAQSRAAADRVSRGVTSLMKKHHIPVISGQASIDEGHRLVVEGENGRHAIESRRVLLAIGSGEKLLPGIVLDPPRVVTSRELLAEPTLPRSMLVIGGGAIGVEFGYVLSCLEVEVTIVEMQGQLLPGTEPEIARELERVLARRGIKLHTSTRFKSLRATGDGVTVELAGEKGEHEVRAERCLVATGREPLVREMGLVEAGFALERGFIRVNRRFETSVDGFLAIGDVIGPPLLAHVAAAEGMAAVETLAGEGREAGLDYAKIPACVYCQPEVATVGSTEAQARERGYEVKVGLMPFRALGRAVASGETEGMVKIVAEARHGEILGCHVLGPCATDLIAEPTLAMAMEGTLWDLGRTVHAHPTFAEAIMEGALAAAGEAINI